MHLFRPIILCAFILSAGSALCAPLEDARAFLREGKRVQAYASLFEAIEKDKEAGEAKLLLDELKKNEAEYLDTKTEAKSDSEDEALKNFKEGVHLKESGDLIGAREKLELSRDALREFSITPSFAGALLDACAELERELEKKYLPEIEDVNGRMLKLGSVAAAEKTRTLLEMEDEVKEIAAALPKNETAMRLIGLFESQVKQSAKNWMAAALAAETLSGCERAGRMYEDIAAVMQKRDGDEARAAMEGAERCGGGR